MKGLIVATGLATALFAGHAQAATYVVQAKGLGFDKALARQIEAAGGQVTARYPQIGVAIVEADPGFAGRATRLGAIESATRDMTLKFEIPGARPLDARALAENPPDSGDDDFLFDLQWGHDAIDAPEAWERGARGAGARVAVLDSGIDCTHPDLTPNLLPALNASFVPGEGACTTLIAFNHGTHVAGTIAAADNGLGTIGVAPEAEIFAVKVLSEFTGSGSFASILEGIVYAADADADVINMSLGVQGGLPITRDTRELIKAVTRAVAYARRHEALVVASAGNDGIDFDTALDEEGNRLMAFPGGVQGVLGVSATGPIGWAINPDTDLDRIASYSSYGRNVVDVAAPGGDFVYPGEELCTVAGVTNVCWAFDMVLSTSPGGWSWSAGTSMAAPHAAGVAALVIGANGGGEINPALLESMISRGADDLGHRGFDPLYGRGRVDADDSID